MSNITVQDVKERVIADNDAVAGVLREELKQKGVFLINLMSSPGSGKTTLLSSTIEDLKDKVNIAVLEADIDSDVDAVKIEKLGAKSVQVHTDGMCHMDAGMTKRGLEGMDLTGIKLAFLENVGNLICPAEFDTGAHKNVMILSVPEGDDKPLKYPLMFTVSDCLLVNKTDTAKVFHFEMDRLKENIKPLNQHMPVFPVSALTGDGFDEWITWLKNEIKTWRLHN